MRLTYDRRCNTCSGDFHRLKNKLFSGKKRIQTKRRAPMKGATFINSFINEFINKFVNEFFLIKLLTNAWSPARLCPYFSASSVNKLAAFIVLFFLPLYIFSPSSLLSSPLSVSWQKKNMDLY